MQRVQRQAGHIQPWRRVVIDIPGPEFEPAPPRLVGGTCPDSECDGWSTPELTLRSASVRGERHRYYRQPRQDATCAVLHEGTGTVVFAVADGLSSATAATVGAAESCRSAVWAIHAQLDEGGPGHDFPAVVSYVVETLRRQAAALLQREDPDLAQVEELVATTLVAGTARSGPDGVELALFRVGDSGAWVLDLTRPWFHPLFAPKTEGDVVASAVFALPRVPRKLEQWFGKLVPGQALLVGTDGFGDPLGDGGGQVGALFAEHLAVPPSPMWLAHLLDFSRETFDDDRTLLALWPRSEGR
ncbi:protein phosphatase 2C domain-containing protein [Nonomuraea zeae]|uniref:protein phosphatase 2C domain-containing protein n=1 Tax=Nonomuraea zeae TaxID=1642303 RepID=UPI0014787E2F|nr:protein phosphatase 2C domain-containing protein [Nonomuraea zeae]